MSDTFKAGLLVLGLLSVLDLSLPLLTDGDNPPMSVALVAAALGLASLALVISAWRGAAGAVKPLIALRVVSAVTAVPAFFTEPPAAAVAAAAVLVVLTLAGTAMLVSGSRRRELVGAR